jgi:two-component system, OmpR family, sensor kinase
VSLPIRVRLTAWYVGLLAVMIVALGVFVATRLRADLISDADRSLRSAATQVRQDLDSRVLRVLPGDSGAQVVAADGRVLRAAGPDLPRYSLLSAARRREVLAGRALRFTWQAPGDDEPFRVYATAAGGNALVVATSLEGQEAAADRVVTLLLIAGPVLLLVTAAGGWWLAGKALRPVARVTERAERIEVDRLDERVPVPRTRDEIARLAQTLNRMLDRLDRGVAERKRLVADASHELRTPLAVMRSELDVALGYDDLGPHAREVLSSASEEVDRMTRTVENLLTLARVDEGRLELLRTPVSLGEVALGVEDDVVVQGDRDRLRQVVDNLVDNARKYGGGDVRVEVWERDGEAGVTVSDDGIGIRADALPHVFDRFYRADDARVRERGGSGLGLAICREIVQAHGGRIWAQSETGRGSSFSFALPLAPGRERAPRTLA